MGDHGTSPPANQYETHYVTAHKGPCTVAAFTCDGRLVATGSNDASIKIIDVERMLAKAAQSQAERQAEKEAEEAGQGMKHHPVIRTMYDHDLTVTTLDFHPQAAILASGGEDKKIKIFDYSKSSVKKAFKTLDETEPIRSLSFHPTGEFLLAAVDHPTVRLYDVNTLQCYVSSNPRDQHTGNLTCVQYCPAAHLYATSSKDGSFKLWDGVSNRCVNTFKDAHGGSPVTSVRFSHNSKYIITGGRDSTVRMWELSTVFFPDDKNMSIGCWDSRTTEKLPNLSSGHNNWIRYLVHSPVDSAFISCSEDYRARFWYCKGS